MAKNILVVDDLPLVLNVVTRMLHLHGYNVLPAANGWAALRICYAEPGPIHLLLTDIDMPDMDGLELARCLRSHRPEVPVLFMTGQRVETQPKSELTNRPAMDLCPFISKPFQIRELIGTIQMLMSN